MGSCQGCLWFDRVDTNTGLCRLVPPVVIPAEVSNRGDTKTKPFTAWPLVRNLDWCGDYDKRS